MNYFLVILALLSLMGNAYSSTLTQPTRASSPLPSLHKTQNIDVVLSEKVQEKITKTHLLKGQHISAASHKCNITLEGSVLNKHQEKIAIKVAQSVPGVKKVRSHLTIRRIK